ncbi:hypothetical protein EV424DRAFT_1345138 [Suillus variegatus]|nr:hypothetical protein EV424DRAFT_1345138 [Suillus variegatus]
MPDLQSPAAVTRLPHLTSNYNLMKPGAASKQNNEGGMFLCFSTSTKNLGMGDMFKSSLLFPSARVMRADEGGDIGSCFTIPGGNDAERRQALTENNDGGHMRARAPKAHPQSTRAVKVTDKWSLVR